MVKLTKTEVGFAFDADLDYRVAVGLGAFSRDPRGLRRPVCRIRVSCELALRDCANGGG